MYLRMAFGAKNHYRRRLCIVYMVPVHFYSGRSAHFALLHCWNRSLCYLSRCVLVHLLYLRVIYWVSHKPLDPHRVRSPNNPRRGKF